MIYLGADHRGFELKESIKVFLDEWRVDYEDMGAHKYDESDDYPEFATKVSEKMQRDEKSLGVLICGSGVGVDVTANKFDGIRASIGKSVEQVMVGRSDDDMNVLVIASDFTRKEEAAKMVQAFLQTKFDGKERHKRRLAEIEKIEEKN